MKVNKELNENEELEEQRIGRHMKLKDPYKIMFLQLFFQWFCYLNVSEFQHQVLRLIKHLDNTFRESITKLYQQTKKENKSLISQIPFFKKERTHNSSIIKETQLAHIPFIIYFHQEWDVPSEPLEPNESGLVISLTKDFCQFLQDYCKPNTLYNYSLYFSASDMPPRDPKQLQRPNQIIVPKQLQ